MAAATQRGEIAAFVDTLRSARCGIGRSRRCGSRSIAVDPGRPRDRSGSRDPGSRIPDPDRAIDRALKALNLVLQAGGFSLVAIDLADVPAVRLRQIPFTTWPRVQRVDRGERHGVCAADAGAAGAQCRRPDVVAGWSIDVDRRVRSQPVVARARSPCAGGVAAEAD